MDSEPDPTDAIYVWKVSTDEVLPLRYQGWWVYYPKPSRQTIQSHPLPGCQAAFAVGDCIRLAGKPEKVRQVLAVVWHRHRHEFVYGVETHSNYDGVYWFGPQLQPES